MEAKKKLGRLCSFHNLCSKLLAAWLAAYRCTPTAGLWSHSCSGESGFAADTHQTSRPRSRQLGPCSSPFSTPPPTTHPHDLPADDPQTSNYNRNNDGRTRQLKLAGGFREVKEASKHQSRMGFHYLPVEHAKKN